MLNQWFYTHKTWQIGLAVDLTLILVALAGLYIFHRLVAWHRREEDTAMVGLSYALAGGLYAVMLAFVAAGTFETMDKSVTIASEEANSLSAMLFDSPGLGPAAAGRMQAGVEQYIDVVTKKEWPCQRAYLMESKNFEQGWAILRRISVDLASFEPATPGQATVKLEIEHAINNLFTARRTRLLAATQHLPGAIWQMLIFGLAMVAVYVYLFGPHSFKIHVAVTTLTMLSVGIVFTVVIVEDYPFRGIVSVDSEAYVGVREVAEHIFHPAEAAPSGNGEHTEGHGIER
jgi:hypothetical protein